MSTASGFFYHIAEEKMGRSNRAASVSAGVLAQRCVGLAGHPLADARGSVVLNGILQAPLLPLDLRSSAFIRVPFQTILFA
jgi:hypothetical protein